MSACAPGFGADVELVALLGLNAGGMLGILVGLSVGALVTLSVGMWVTFTAGMSVTLSIGIAVGEPVSVAFGEVVELAGLDIGEVVELGLNVGSMVALAVGAAVGDLVQVGPPPPFDQVAWPGGHQPLPNFLLTCTSMMIVMMLMTMTADNKQWRATEDGQQVDG